MMLTNENVLKRRVRRNLNQPCWVGIVARW